MLNQVVVVGRLVNDVEIEKLNDDKEIYKIVLATPRSYKNENGEYDTDFIKCILFENVGKNTKEYCKKGDLIGIKGRIDSNLLNDKQIVIAEKVTFLSSQRSDN